MKAKAIKNQLDQCPSFEAFFIKVSEIKIERCANVKKLKKLRTIVREYNTVYDHKAINHLCQCITAEIVLGIIVDNTISMEVQA
ncbi:hypothetical protein [Eubacterium callanderi]|uniref:hypothetical protein n=1 Tax=Eubacterium callanderi TaxID=53442 RepID=UPI001D1590C4|nr:hypothetical protein [Eubacterium callanderi]MCC3401084.1 hypothetical protein [Eubacterium callanderi]